MDKKRVYSILETLTQEEKNTQLIGAVKNNNIIMVELWLSIGAEATAFNNYAIERAKKYGYIDILNKLLKAA